MDEQSASGFGHGGRTCLVTGCAGFLGGSLTRRLLDLGHSVVGVDSLFSGRAENMLPFIGSPRFRFVEKSIEEPGLADELFQAHGPIHSVFHLAAIVDQAFSLHHPDETYAVNVHATERLLACAEKHAALRFVFAGSAAEYGSPACTPVPETCADGTQELQSPYANSKLLATRAVAKSPIGVSLRLFNVFGPWQPPRSPYSGVISRLVTQALGDRPLALCGDGDATADFVFVKDAVQALLAAAGLAGERTPPPGVYNVGSGKAVKLLALARMVLILTDKPAAILMDIPGGEADGESAPCADILGCVADITAISGRSDWRPETVLSVGLARTIAWQRQVLGI